MISVCSNSNFNWMSFIFPMEQISFTQCKTKIFHILVKTKQKISCPQNHYKMRLINNLYHFRFKAVILVNHKVLTINYLTTQPNSIRTLMSCHTLVGEERSAQIGLFCSANFGRSIYSLLRIVSCLIGKIVQCRVYAYNDFIVFVFLNCYRV